MKPYRDYADYLADIFGPLKVQKLTVNAFLGCPNRDGTIGRGGCVYCNVGSFTPDMGHGDVAAQLERAKSFFAAKYPEMKYLAYFQAYTNTHGTTERLMKMYQDALAVDDVVGLIIGTRPDCMPDELLERLAALNRQGRPVIIEFGAESSHDTTLKRVNRCHTWACTVDAVRRTRRSGLDVGLHFIMGLPGETPEMMLETIDRINDLDISTVKFHQLQVIRHTPLATMFEREGAEGCGIHQWTVDSYADMCVEIIRRLRGDIAIERFVSQAPADMLIFPRWGLKNYQFTSLVRGRLGRG